MLSVSSHTLMVSPVPCFIKPCLSQSKCGAWSRSLALRSGCLCPSPLLLLSSSHLFPAASLCFVWHQVIKGHQTVRAQEEHWMSSSGTSTLSRGELQLQEPFTELLKTVSVWWQAISMETITPNRRAQPTRLLPYALASG